MGQEAAEDAEESADHRGKEELKVGEVVVEERAAEAKGQEHAGDEAHDDQGDVYFPHAEEGEVEPEGDQEEGDGQAEAVEDHLDVVDLEWAAETRQQDELETFIRLAVSAGQLFLFLQVTIDFQLVVVIEAVVFIVSVDDHRALDF